MAADMAVGVDVGTWVEVQQFLFHEAELLDDDRQREWLDLVTEDIDYRVPVRVTRERAAGKGFSTTSFHMAETWGMLETRVLRLETEYAFAEDPPSRTRRYVTNVRIEPTSAVNELEVKSNLLIYRNRNDESTHQLIAGERHDRLRRTEKGWKIARRTVYLDQATLGTHNLAIFL
jgi:3-phenylpropionate/cinnamic acid dioxygenase small subunit